MGIAQGRIIHPSIPVSLRSRSVSPSSHARSRSTVLSFAFVPPCSPSIPLASPFHSRFARARSLNPWLSCCLHVIPSRLSFHTAAQKQQQQKEQDAQKKAQLQKQKEEQRGHEESKNAVRLSLRKSLLLSGREEWQRRLDDKGLQGEDWVDVTYGEQQAVQRLLGGDFDDEEEEGDEEEDEDS